MNTLTADIQLVLPEIAVFSMACVILVADLFLPERARAVSYVLAQLALVVAALLTVGALTAPPASAFNRMFVSDPLAGMLKLAIYALSFFVFAYSRDYLTARGLHRG